MNAKEYLQKAEKPKIVIIDDEGNEQIMELKSIERPGLQDLRKICSREVSFGRATFVDTFVITVPYPCHVAKAILYYDDLLAGLREFPSILMQAGDGLTIKYVLTIVIDHSQVSLGE